MLDLEAFSPHMLLWLLWVDVTLLVFTVVVVFLFENVQTPRERSLSSGTLTFVLQWLCNVGSKRGWARHGGGWNWEASLFCLALFVFFYYWISGCLAVTSQRERPQSFSFLSFLNAAFGGGIKKEGVSLHDSLKFSRASHRPLLQLHRLESPPAFPSVPSSSPPPPVP